MTAQSHHNRRTPGARQRVGFTLVELLVVIAIIGILSAILIPVVSVVVTSSKEAAITVQVNQAATAVESYKNEFSVYPIDMGNPALLQSHVAKLSRDHQHGIVYDSTNPSNPNTWYGATLANPHYDANDPNSPATRRPITMDASEGWVFFLYELSKNVEYPLGYRWDATNNAFIYLPGERYQFFEFKDTLLRDYDNDGWLEYVQAKGPEIPLVYFEAKSYLIADPIRPVLQSPNGIDAQLQWGNIGGEGWAQPYFEEWDNWPNQAVASDWPTQFVEATRFQLISAGMDGDFGDPYLQATSPASKHFYAGPKSFVLSRGELDNIASFSEARMDRDLEQ